MERRKAIGIVIGGTRTSLGIVSAEGMIEIQTQFDTNPRTGFDFALERIADAIYNMCAKVDLDPALLVGIGVGSTGPVDHITGIIRTDFTLPTWGGRNIIQGLKGLFKTHVLLENDVDVAVFGEAFLENEQSLSSVVLMTFGTGVGGGVLLNGKIYRGSQGEHPEIGHMLVRRAGPKCYCGMRGCLEMIASGKAIARAGQRFGMKDSYEVFARAKDGDPRARKIIDSAIDSVALGVWNILHTFLPERIILGGGIMDEHYQMFEPAVRKIIDKATMIPKDGVSLSKARVGNEAGIVGAAALCFQ
jgi:glucokinase